MTGIYCPVRLRTGRRRWRVSSPPGSTRALSQIIVRVVSPVSSPVLLPHSPHQITKYSSLSPQKKPPRPGSLQYHIRVAATVAVFPSSYYRRHVVLPVLSVIDSVQVPVKIESEKLASHIRHIFDQSYIYIYIFVYDTCSARIPSPFENPGSLGDKCYPNFMDGEIFQNNY